MSVTHTVCIRRLTAALEEIIRATHDRRDFTSRRVNSIAVAAIAIEARRVETEGLDAKHESATEGDAQ